MKIKTQLRFFLIGTVLVPAVAMLVLPIYNSLTRPEKTVTDGEKIPQILSELPFPPGDKKIIGKTLKHLPPNMEFLLLMDKSTILSTTFPDLADKKTTDVLALSTYIAQTSGTYFYQISTPPLRDKRQETLLITRISYENKLHKDGFRKGIILFTIFIGIFEVFCITVIVSISSTISKSVTVLDKNTQRIAQGNLDVHLEYKKNTKADNEITSLTENLDKMRLALKDSTERRERFIMGISHDLRTPVAVIKGYTEAINDGLFQSTEEMAKSLEIISDKTDQLENMINTLINFVKLNKVDWLQQLKKQKIAPVFHEFAGNAVTTGGIFKRDVRASVRVSPETEISFDRNLVMRAFENLFSNALRYTNENDSIEITAVQDEKLILFTISDTGIGIEEEDLDKIFDMFYRASKSRREEGMGIGLSTVQTIIKAHGWSISVDSAPGKETVFSIEIPIP